jgi:hypothetical protein
MPTTTSVFLPDEQEHKTHKKPPQSVRPNRHESAVSESTAPDDTEFQQLNEEQLKAAIVSAWKKLERIGKKDMGPLLYWLREKLRAQGSRNDIRDRDKGFGAWVEKTIEISRRTADRWADSYGLGHGLIKRKSTSRHDVQKLFSTEGDDFYSQELRKHGRQIQMNYWVTQSIFKRYETAVKVLRRHFKTTSTQEAVVKGALYAAENLASRRGKGATSKALGATHAKGTSALRSKARHVQGVHGANGHRRGAVARAARADAKPTAFRAAAG